MPPLRDTLSRRSKTSCNRSYSPLLCRSRKSVSLSWRDGPLSANSIFTPTPPMQKQYGFLTVCKNREMRSFRESALSKVIPLTSGRDSAATAPMSTLLICSSSCVVNFTVPEIPPSCAYPQSQTGCLFWGMSPAFLHTVPAMPARSGWRSGHNSGLLLAVSTLSLSATPPFVIVLYTLILCA